MVSNIEIVMRLILATFIGGLIGVEREKKNRAAGFRTHILVTIGSSLIMLVSLNMGPNADPSRIAAQVVSGIGFLGAGTIITDGGNIRGLTTAASLWVCGGIGLAIGSGYYLGAIAASIIVFLSLSVLNNLEKKIVKTDLKTIKLKCTERAGMIGDIGQFFGDHGIIIEDMQMNRDVHEDGEDIIELEFELLIKSNIVDEEISTKLKDIDGVKDVGW